ncbi:MAG: DUF2059 domain-containing protein [Rhodanobacter sp.]|nr:MAG: DUF2059 domain-containing protein [Rhodanobacter sp.]TAM02570.1 MAG: DUF2059 domain-containing protein [Rhodanobacter sp.]TAM42980.1 MAG: DUF2059 domain-containing protein [Rhodanobacter sp.]TAN28136.1 MAG: DUF2059 domain-containing protein [Rhodanobacter sp.]
MRKWIGIAVGTAFALGGSGQAMAARPSNQQVRQLFEVMHLGQMFGQMNSQMAGIMGQAVPCVPASYWQNFIDASNSEQLLGKMVPVYQAHFTAEDVAGLLKFYKSPLGQKVITQMPITMAQGMKIGQQWGRQRGEAMIKELQHKGTLDAEGRCPGSPAAKLPSTAPDPGH